MSTRTRALLQPLLLLAAGLLIGALVGLDPWLAHRAGRIPLHFGGVHLLRVWPYEITSLVLLGLAAAAAAAALLRWILTDPEKSFVLLFLFLYFTVRLHIAGRADGTDLLLLVYLVVFLLEGLRGRRRVRGFPVLVLNLIFLASVLPSSMNGGPASLVNAVVKVGKFSAVALLLANFVTRESSFRTLIRWYLIVVVLSAVAALVQEVLYVFTGTAYVGFVSDYERHLMFEMTALGPLLRVSGFVPGYKLFGNLTLLGIFLVLNRLLYDPPRKRGRRWFMVLCIALMVAALFLTFSKDAVLGLVLGLGLSVLFRWPQRLFHLVLAAAAAGLVLYAGGGVEWILKHLGGSDFSTRIQLLREGIQGFAREHPWLGTGLNRGSLYTSHVLHWPVHNGLVLAADEFGLFGLVSFLALIGYNGYNLVRCNLRARRRGEIWVVRGVLLGFVAFVVSMNIHPTLMDNLLWLYMGLVYLLGAVPRAAREGTGRSAVSTSPGRR